MGHWLSPQTSGLLPTPPRVLVSWTPAQLCAHVPLPAVQVRLLELVKLVPAQTSGPVGDHGDQPLTVRGLSAIVPVLFRVSPQALDCWNDWPLQTSLRAGVHAPRDLVPVLVPVCVVCTPTQLHAQPPHPSVPFVQTRLRDLENELPEQTLLRAGLQSLQPVTVRVTHGSQVWHAGRLAHAPSQLVPVLFWVSPQAFDCWKDWPLQTVPGAGVQAPRDLVPVLFRVFVSVAPAQLTVQEPVPAVPGVQVRVPFCVKLVPWHTVPGPGVHTQVDNVRLVHGVPLQDECPGFVGGIGFEGFCSVVG